MLKTMNPKSLAGALGALLAGAALSAAGAADGGKTATLDKIGGYGAIYLGYREAAIPFSYVDDEGRVQGYSWELCLRVVDAVKARLGRQDLVTVAVPASPGAFTMMVETGTIDLYCGSATNTEQRSRYVGFSNTYFVSGVKALVRRDAGIGAIADLKGRTIVTTAGTASDAYVRTAAVRRNIAVNYRTARTHQDAFNDVLGGRADAFVLDDVLLRGLLAGAAEADARRLQVLDENLGLEPYGLMFRRNDPDFKKLVDDTLVGLMKNGEIERIYAKWFVSAIPPKGASLDLPMSAELRQLIKTPNDKGI